MLILVIKYKSYPNQNKNLPKIDKNFHLQMQLRLDILSSDNP